MANNVNGDHVRTNALSLKNQHSDQVDMNDLSPKNQYKNDDVPNYSHANGNGERSGVISSLPVDSRSYDERSNVNTTSLEIRHLPSSRRSTDAYGSNSHTRNRRAAESDAVDPLLDDAEIIPKPRPPIANPELDDDETDSDNNIPNTPKDHPGVDDGFFPVDIEPRVGNDDPKNESTPKPPNGVIPSGRRPSVNNFPYAPGFGGYGPLDGVPQIIPDVNVYQQKKNLAQGMMDLALLSANANQLRYVLESYDRHPYYYFSLVFISMSLLLQIAVGIGLIMNSRYDVRKDDHICKADRINNFTIFGIFLITIVNVFISSFGVADPPAVMNNGST